MPAPFYQPIKGTTSGTPGTGAFTPNAASTGFLAWSTVPTNWIGLVRFEDGSAWELQYSFWNGTTLSRAASTQFVASSTGSALTLTSAATAAMVADANSIAPHKGGAEWAGAWAIIGGTGTFFAKGLAGLTVTGTPGAEVVAITSHLTEQIRAASNSATTANAQAAFTATSNSVIFPPATAGRGGFEFSTRWGFITSFPTGYRVFSAVTDTTLIANTGEPSALVGNWAAFLKDSTDTNMQFATNNGSGGGTKTDIGIALAIDSWYWARIWADPGGATYYGLFINLTTGAIWYGSRTTDLPTNVSGFMQVVAGLSATTGTAIKPRLSHLLSRGGV